MFLSKLQTKFLNPQNIGKCADENGVARNASVVCGASLRIGLQINEQTQIIENAKFNALGCSCLISFAETLCDCIKGKNVKEVLEEFSAKSQGRKENLIENEIGDFPENRRHCLTLCFETFTSAINDFKAQKLESWNGDEVLICTCFGVSEREIEKAITENFCETVDEVTNICNAGGGCGSCQPLIEEIIENNRQESNN